MTLPLPPIQKSKQLNEFLIEVYRQLQAGGGGGGGSGTVTSVAVTSANGFSGTVANSTTTPAITMRTTITGMLKGNGTAISAASAGVDYESPGSFTSQFLLMGG